MGENGHEAMQHNSYWSMAYLGVPCDLTQAT